MVGPADDETVAITDQHILACLAGESMQALPPSAKARAVAAMLNVPKSRVYALMVSDPGTP